MFSAVGTAGQRCTSLRRLIVHEAVHDTLVARLKGVYQNLPIGDPLERGTLVGPLIDASAFRNMNHALAEAAAQGGRVSGGERALQSKYPERALRPAGDRRDAGPDGDRARGDVRARFCT